MSRYAEPMSRLIDELKKLPGVGTKTAQRYAFHLLRSSAEDASALADAVHNLKASLRLCSICNNVTDVDPCTYCSNPVRNQRQICVVEEPTSIASVERTRGYNGVYHVLRSSDEDAAALADAVRALKASLRLCSICNNVTDVDPCAYCTSPTRNQRLVCVVEEPTSIASVERTRGYNGVYHVLHGTLSPLHGVGPDQLRSTNLLVRVERGDVDEVILATSPTLEGEATASWLAAALHHTGHAVKVTRIATGVPAGSDIEYADEVSMARAIEGRRDF